MEKQIITLVKDCRRDLCCVSWRRNYAEEEGTRCVEGAHPEHRRRDFKKEKVILGQGLILQMKRLTGEIGQVLEYSKRLDLEKIQVEELLFV